MSMSTVCESVQLGTWRTKEEEMGGVLLLVGKFVMIYHPHRYKDTASHTALGKGSSGKERMEL